MKVLFEGFWWKDGPPSGRMVVREIVLNWANLFPNDELILASPKKIDEDLPKNVQHRYLRLAPHALSVMLELTVLAHTEAVDAVISQNFGAFHRNSAAFMHDSLFQSNPEFFSFKERLYLSMIPLSLRGVRHVFTSSNTEARRIAQHNPKLRSIIPVGIAVGQGLADAEPEPVKLANGTGTYCLAVGRLNVRKNLRTVFEACYRSNVITPENPLLIVGAPDGLDDIHEPYALRMINSGAIRYLGYVKDEQLRWLYENSRSLIFMSRDEGFGLPPLEALSFGCPVIVSDIPVFRELYEGAAVFISPDDVEGLAQALKDLLSSAPVSVSPASLGQVFSWESTIKKMRNVLIGGSE